MNIVTCFLLGLDPARSVTKTFKNSVSRVWSCSCFTKERQHKQSHRKGERPAEKISLYITWFKIGIRAIFFSPVSSSLFLRVWAYPFPSLRVMLCIICHPFHVLNNQLDHYKTQTVASLFTFTSLQLKLHQGCLALQHPKNIDRFLFLIIVFLSDEVGSLGYTPGIWCPWWKKLCYIQLQRLLKCTKPPPGQWGERNLIPFCFWDSVNNLIFLKSWGG